MDSKVAVRMISEMYHASCGMEQIRTNDNGPSRIIRTARLHRISRDLFIELCDRQPTGAELDEMTD